MYYYDFFRIIVEANYIKYHFATKENKPNETVFLEFFNTIVSINQIPDYLFFSFRDKWKIENINSERVLKEKLYKNNQIIKDIANIANTCKHCEPNSTEKRMNDIYHCHRSVFMKHKLIIDDNNITIKTLQMESNIEYGGITLRKDDKIICDAMKFWYEIFETHCFDNIKNTLYKLNTK
jgi:hypothetical protein